MISYLSTEQAAQAHLVLCFMHRIVLTLCGLPFKFAKTRESSIWQSTSCGHDWLVGCASIKPEISESVSLYCSGSQRLGSKPSCLSCLSPPLLHCTSVLQSTASSSSPWLGLLLPACDTHPQAMPSNVFHQASNASRSLSSTD